jgi:hypothetical protein
MKWVEGGILVANPGAQLRDPLDTNVQGFELLTDDAFRHASAQVLYQQPHTAVLREREGVEAHTLFHIKGTQLDDRVSETIAG